MDVDINCGSGRNGMACHARIRIYSSGMLLFLTFKLLDRKKFFRQNLNSDGGAPLQHKSLTMNLESASQGDYPPKITTCCKDIVVCLTHVIGPHYICCLKLLL